MADEAAQALDAKLERGERLIAMWRELSATDRVAAGNHNHLSTVFNLGGAGLIFGLCFGSICLGAAIGLFFKLEATYDRMESRELVMAAERKADLRELSTLKRDVANLQVYNGKNGERITLLEAKTDGEQSER